MRERKREMFRYPAMTVLPGDFEGALRVILYCTEADPAGRAAGDTHHRVDIAIPESDRHDARLVVAEIARGWKRMLDQWDYPRRD